VGDMFKRADPRPTCSAPFPQGPWRHLPAQTARLYMYMGPTATIRIEYYY